MRSIPFLLLAFAFSAPALAQSWEEYSYPEYAISVAFPTIRRLKRRPMRLPMAVRPRHASIQLARTKASSR